VVFSIIDELITINFNFLGTAACAGRHSGNLASIRAACTDSSVEAIHNLKVIA
jgi:hypothetical protein